MRKKFWNWEIWVWKIGGEIGERERCEDVGKWGKVLLGEERGRGKSGRDSGGVRLDVESREACEELRRALLFSRLELPRLPFPIPQSVSFIFYSSILIPYPNT